MVSICGKIMQHLSKTVNTFKITQFRNFEGLKKDWTKPAKAFVEIGKQVPNV